MTYTGSVIDYAGKSLTIQQAFVDHAKRFPKKEDRPHFIYWDGRKIFAADKMQVPQRGFVKGEFIQCKCDLEQGFDLALSGYLELANGDKVATLRTWYDPQYESVVEYPFLAQDGVLHVWNVYKMVYPAGQVVEEKWTENAGFWIEIISDLKRIYHCSHGMANPPDFESLVFEIFVHS